MLEKFVDFVLAQTRLCLSHCLHCLGVKVLTAAGIAFNSPNFLHQRLEQMMVQNIIIPATEWVTELFTVI
jgi:hypothetical protein